MSKRKFPRPSIPAGVLHREADAAEVLTDGSVELSIPLTDEIAAWVLYALVADLHRWHAEPRPKAVLRLEEARTFAVFLHDLLPEHRRSEVPRIDGSQASLTTQAA